MKMQQTFKISKTTKRTCFIERFGRRKKPVFVCKNLFINAGTHKAVTISIELIYKY